MDKEFLVLKQLNTRLLGLSFFKHNGIYILTKTGMLQLPDITVQLNSMLKPFQNRDPPKSKRCNKNNNLFTKADITLKPFTMEKIECEPERDWKHKEITGVIPIFPFPHFCTEETKRKTSHPDRLQKNQSFTRT